MYLHCVSQCGRMYLHCVSQCRRNTFLSIKLKIQLTLDAVVSNWKVSVIIMHINRLCTNK
jgi:hypothetical protein